MAVSFTPWEPEVHRNPYPQFRELREHDPVHRVDLLIGWLLTRYSDCAEVLRDARFSSENRRATIEQLRREDRDIAVENQPAVDAFFEHSMLFRDAPDHTRLRGLVSRAFTPRTVTRLRPRIEEVTHELAERIAGAGPTDFIAEFAAPLPAIVIAELLGVPKADRAQFRTWSDALVFLLDPITSPERRVAAGAACGGLYDYLTDIAAERRRAPADDLISALVALEAEEDALSPVELIGMCMLLLAAGHETTTNLLGNGMAALLEHPDQELRLRQEPGLVRPAIEEFLRFESPVQGMPRVALEDCEIDGRQVAKGDYVVVVVGAANRDPERFPDPDRLDVGRRDNKHLAFGHGAHFCMGAPLALAEAEIAFATLLARFPAFKGDYERLDFKPTQNLRGLEALPMSF